jgi:hypothetical protein
VDTSVGGVRVRVRVFLRGIFRFGFSVFNKWMKC